MTKNTVIACLIAATALSVSYSYAESDKLLLSEYASKIDMSFRVDGKAIRATVVNKSSQVVTSGALVCAPYDVGRPRPKMGPDGRKVCEEIGESLLALRSTPNACLLDSDFKALRFPFEQTVMPKRLTESYLP